MTDSRTDSSNEPDWLSQVDAILDAAVRGADADELLRKLPASVASRVVAMSPGLLRFAEPDRLPRVSEAAPGRMFGPFRVLDSVGRGGQAVVYRAEDTRSGGVVALKVTPCTSEGVRRLQREAATLSRLDDPGICAALAVGRDEDQAWLAMRFVEGETLASAIRRWRDSSTSGTPIPPIEYTVSLVQKIAEAVQHAHEVGVVHRDLKPANIMITPTGDPVVLDFGLARFAGDETQTLTRPGQQPGTPAYMAPEQVAGNAQVDQLADIWALGLIAFECLTLERPFQRSTAEQTFRAILEDEPGSLRELRAGVSADLALVVKVALEKPRWARYASAAAFAHDLGRARDGRPLAYRRPAWTRRVWGSVVRHPLLAIACLAFAGLGILGISMTVETWQSGVAASGAALRVGRLDRAFEELMHVPHWWVAWTGDEDLVDFAARRNSPEDPLIAASTALAEGDPPAALLHLAAPIRVDGPVEHPLVFKVLTWVFDSSRNRGALPWRRPEVLEGIGRLVTDREPSDTSDTTEAEAWSPLLNRVRRAWEQGEDSRLRLLTCFYGLGTTEDAENLLDWLSGDLTTEERRLGNQAVAAIVRRAHRHNTIDERSLDGLWELARKGSTTDLVLRALLLAEREAFPGRRILPRLSGIRMVDSGTDNRSALVRYAAGDHGAFRELKDRIEEDRIEAEPYFVGLAMGLLGIDIHNAPLPLSEDLRDGHADGVAERNGILVNHLPDRASLLGAPSAGLYHPTPVGPSNPQEATCSAQWVCESGGMTLRGWATSAAGCDVVEVVERAADPRFIKFLPRGSSAVDLWFEVPQEAPRKGSVKLELRHMIGTRVYLPYGGKARLRIELDGELAGEGIVRFAMADLDAYQLPPSALKPGKHRVRISLAPSSNTTYRLYEASLTVGE